VRAFLEQVSTRALAKLRPLRNWRFQSRLQHDPAAPCVLLSPHLDDAVIDCWSVLATPSDLRVVNVFAGVPRSGGVAYFDRLAGATDSAVHVEERIADDLDALGRAGRHPLNLDFLAEPYRAGRPEASFEELDAALAANTPAAARGLPVRLYADLPYCAVYGWPAWVTGRDPDPHLDIEAFWNGSGLTAAGAEVVHLDPEQGAAKLAAMRAYREFAMLDRGPVGQLSNPAIHRYEVFWAVDGGGC
jgi:hypothetical protein